jgi:hypothetical protein
MSTIGRVRSGWSDGQKTDPTWVKILWTVASYPGQELREIFPGVVEIGKREVLFKRVLGVFSFYCQYDLDHTRRSGRKRRSGGN